MHHQQGGTPHPCSQGGGHTVGRLPAPCPSLYWRRCRPSLMLRRPAPLMMSLPPVHDTEEEPMDNLLQRIEALEDEVRIVRRRLRLWRQLAGSVLVLALVGLLQPWGLAAQAPEEDLDRSLWQLLNLWGRVNALERKLVHVTSVTGAGGLSEVVITGANLRLVNGVRATATTNGL